MSGRWPGGTFDVTKLAVYDSGGSEQEIIDSTQDFDIAVDFVGTGAFLANEMMGGLTFQVAYSAEGIGVGAPEVDLGTTPPIPCTAAHAGNYTKADTQLRVSLGTLPRGVYEISALVTFNLVGPCGFLTDVPLQVY
jgi:hypothetical protein